MFFWWYSPRLIAIHMGWCQHTRGIWECGHKLTDLNPLHPLHEGAKQKLHWNLARLGKKIKKKWSASSCCCGTPPKATSYNHQSSIAFVNNPSCWPSLSSSTFSPFALASTLCPILITCFMSHVQNNNISGRKVFSWSKTYVQPYD